MRKKSNIKTGFASQWRGKKNDSDIKRNRGIKIDLDTCKVIIYAFRICMRKLTFFNDLTTQM